MKSVAFSALILAGLSIGVTAFTAYESGVFDDQVGRAATQLDGTPFEAARAWYKNYPHWGSESNSNMLAEVRYFNSARDEVVETLAVVDFLSSGEVGVALTRYSIGREVYRGSVWMREVDGHWYPSVTQWYSSYRDDPFDDGGGERAKEIIEAAEEWEEESPQQWWLWY
ncbi:MULTISPECIES: hypothetical protein [unclassified Halomonas]|uniref:hypothetical protein n=1 Tax=unclassified Halomonas TaxID=2609666 RepID=UPI001EF444D7|nr:MULTISPECIES: hypothetical protein [unclassified Halomonas]MCG7576200.1 hypothetical protein [Halomonas sp. MMH1-48]MCG7603020.1 hypothetical protein [Halomonas sp. MM17-34]MCG7612270.1 hypothetical protein [Halomonas sp. MM17-29]MCG7619151.1 hypothetical protein [Halomonas sp. DSH1-27]